MSHLIIEQGKGIGTEITVPLDGMKFGRSPANDLVLEDETIMLFQGRFFFKSDGALWATDFSAVEKTRIGGQPIDEVALTVGDLVETGTYAFRVIGVRSAAETPAPEAVGVEAEDDAIDLGFQSSEPVRKKNVAKDPAEQKPPSFGHRLLQVSIALLVILVVALAVPEVINLNGGKVIPLQEKEEQLAFSYECVRGNETDVFRYYIELTADGTASIEIDNLGNRHNAKSVKVAAETLKKLSRRLSGSGFFEINRNYVIEALGSYEYYNIAIYCNGEFNQVRVLNREMPQDLRRTISTLEEFAFSALDISSTLLEDEATLIRFATESFKLGEARYSERDVKMGNLARSIKHYTEGLDYLETLDLKPDVHEQIKVGLAKAESERDIRYKDYKFNADRAIRLGDWREADRQLRVLSELIPDRDDHRHETIIAKQLEVGEHLR
ncbi:MAG: FHA domain-containing protein [Pontiella sp.]